MKKVDISARIALGITLFFLIALCISQWMFHNKVNQFVKEIENLQAKKDSILSLLDTSKVSAQYLALQQENQKFQSERFAVELEKQKQSLFAYFVAFLGIGTLAGLYALFFLVPKEIEKKAKLEVDEKIVDAIKGRNDDIRFMLNTYDTESFLKNKKRVYITGGTEKNKIKDILEENGINPENICLDEDAAKKNGFDIMFFNNLKGDILSNKPQKDKDGEINPEAMDQYNQALKTILETMQVQKRSVCFFYYNETNVTFPNWEIKDYDLKKRINFATNPAQIYGNLLNTLKYQDKIQQQQ